MIIAHSLVEELGARRTNTILAMLENPELELAPADQAAFRRFLERLADNYGQEAPEVRQLLAIRPDKPECPERES